MSAHSYSIATQGLAGRKIPQGTLTPIGTLLFSASEQGAWYDPSDLSTLFQDAAGSTPVTAVEQPVGRMLDKSGRGNHATQATTTKRPVYSRRVNMLNNSALNNSGALPTGWGGVGPVPTGVATNGDVIYSASTEVSRKYIEQYFSFVAGVTYQIDIEITEATGVPAIQNIFSVIAAGTHTYKQFGVTVSGASLVAPGKASLIYTPASTGTFSLRVGSGVQSNATASVSFHSPSLVTAADAHLPYQRVNTATDYDADPAKFPAYLRFEVDDALQTGNIDFTSTDKMTVWAGLSLQSKSGIIMELSANGGTNFGTFRLQNFLGSGSSGDSVSYGSSGSNIVLATNSPPINGAAPTVITGLSDISADYTRVRADGIFGTTNSSDQGTGNYGNYPLYIGARGGTSQYFNGRLYSLIVRGAQTPLSQIEATEFYIKQKMRTP